MPFFPDARALTDFRPSCEINKELMNQNGITSNYEYRRFLELNAKKIATSNAQAVMTEITDIVANKK